MSENVVGNENHQITGAGVRRKTIVIWVLDQSSSERRKSRWGQKSSNRRNGYASKVNLAGYCAVSIGNLC